MLNFQVLAEDWFNKYVHTYTFITIKAIVLMFKIHIPMYTSK